MKILYRPEIDGLRAIAIISVILYHANFFSSGYPLFQGGFIGVDIFFVISGYLITSLILKEIYQTNEFSFKHFYERRIRRILPALLFVMIVSSIAGYFLLLPYSYVGLAKSIISSIFFSSNFYFHYSGNNYGEENSLLKPLLHTWSLSVEEQFYILFPIFLLVIFKFFRKHLFKFLFLGFCLSLIFAEYCSKTTHVSFGFYQLPARGFELLLGSLLSYFELNKKKREGPKIYSILNKICPSLGIILILYSFIFFNYNKIFHPGIITLIPIIGVALIIWFSKKGEFTTEILSSKILVFLGLISYSLYLWHYLIFAYLRYIDLFNTLHIKLLSITLVIIFSILSYYFIERPFRNKNIISAKILIAYILTSMIILLSFSFYTLKTEGFINKIPEKIRKNIVNKENNKIAYKNNNKLNNVILIGDSQANSIADVLNEELKKTDYGLIQFHTIFFIKDFNLIDRKTLKTDHAFKKKNDYIYTFLKSRSDQIVIINHIWGNKILEKNQLNEEQIIYSHDKEKNLTPYYLEPNNIKTLNTDERIKYLKNGIKYTLEDILKKNHRLILIYPTPQMEENLYNKINNNLLFDKEIKIISSDYNEHKIKNKEALEILDSVQGPNVYRIYVDKYFCNTEIINRCLANNNEDYFYSDGTHLSPVGSKYVVNDIIKIIQEIKINK